MSPCRTTLSPPVLGVSSILLRSCWEWIQKLLTLLVLDSLKSVHSSLLEPELGTTTDLDLVEQ